MLRGAVVHLALACHGRPYKWGGREFITGWDPPGFIVWVLSPFEIVPRFDCTTHQLLWWARSQRPPLSNLPALGNLAFYGADPEKPDHLMLTISGDAVIGPINGGPRCTTLVEAARRHASVQICGLHYRPDLTGVVPIKYPDE
jgi:hypothetical protein